MKFKEIGTILLAAILLFGCSSSTKEGSNSTEEGLNSTEDSSSSTGDSSSSTGDSSSSTGGDSKTSELYQGLKAEKIFDRVMDKMNEEITYVHIVADSDVYTFEYHNFLINKKVNFLQKYVEKENNNRVSYTLITTDKIFTTDYANDGKISIHSTKNNGTSMALFNSLFKMDVKLIDAKRINKDKKTILEMRYSSEYLSKYDEGGDAVKENFTTIYSILEVTINNSGYIEKEVTTQYTDDTFKTVDKKAIVNTSKYSGYNTKTKDDFNKLVDIIKSSNGKSIDKLTKELEK